MTGLDEALAEAGGLAAPRARLAGLRALLLDELDHGRAELARPRSGYARSVLVAISPAPRGLRAVAPVDPALRADPAAAGERSWLLVAALAGALSLGAELPVAGEPALRAGHWEGALALALPLAGESPAEAAELAALAFEEQVAAVDRLRARAIAVPEALLAGAADLRPPIGADHPLRAAEIVARLGGRPADEASLAEHEDAVLELLGAQPGAPRPHEDADPARRIARRILQRLAGMGKWGGYHTEFVHLARGFAGNERALALEVGERLLAAGLLAEKPSVGQRHVFLEPRRAAAIHALIERGELPAGLELPS